MSCMYLRGQNLIGETHVKYTSTVTCTVPSSGSSGADGGSSFLAGWRRTQFSNHMLYLAHVRVYITQHMHVH